MNLGAYDRPRPKRELDRLQKLGIKNLRILAASEGPDSQRWRVVPAPQIAPGVYNQKLLEGLEYLGRCSPLSQDDWSMLRRKLALMRELSAQH